MNIGEGSGEGGHQITPGSRLADDGKRFSSDGRFVGAPEERLSYIGRGSGGGRARDRGWAEAGG